MKRTTLMLIAALAVTVGAGAWAGARSDARTIANAAWLAGAWRGGDGADVYEEHWMSAQAGCVPGAFRWTSGDAVRLHLFMLIEEDAAAGLTLRMRMYGAEMRPLDEGVAVYTLTHAAPGVLVFEQSTPAPKRVEYRLEGDTLVATVEQGAGDDATRLVFAMERVQ